MSAGGLPPRSGISQLQLFFSSFGKWQNWESWWPDFQNISQIDSKIFANIWERFSAKHCNTIVGAESAKSQINPDHDCTVCVSQIWTFFAQTSQFLYTHDVPIFLHFLCKNVIKRIFVFILPIFFYFLCKNISKRKLAFLALFLGGGGGGGLPIEYITLQTAPIFTADQFRWWSQCQWGWWWWWWWQWRWWRWRLRRRTTSSCRRLRAPPSLSTNSSSLISNKVITVMVRMMVMMMTLMIRVTTQQVRGWWLLWSLVRTLICWQWNTK